MTDARHVVTVRIASEFKQFPDIGMKPLDIGMLEPRDASLARAIDHAIHRRWVTLSALISHASNKTVSKFDPPVGATLLVATAQLMILDRIPDHAVIHCAVDWIKNNGHPRAAGFVNAVLRNITRLRGELLETTDARKSNQFLRNDGTAWQLAEPVFKAGISTQTGFLARCWARLVEELGERVAGEVAVGSITEAPVIVTVPSGEILPKSITPHQEANFGIVPPGTNLAALFSESKTLRAQDPTSAKAVEFVKDIQVQRILDVCAGRGTKTKQLRALFPNAMIGATEPNDSRREYLQEVARVINAEVYSAETGGPTEPFDLVVVDVPCSNSGVFARRPEARYRYDQKHIRSLVTLQQEILTGGVKVLQNKGYLLYATCSIDSAENTSQVQWVTKHLPVKHIDDKLIMPSGYPGSDPTTWHDGGFVALFQRR